MTKSLKIAAVVLVPLMALGGFGFYKYRCCMLEGDGVVLAAKSPLFAEIKQYKTAIRDFEYSKSKGEKKSQIIPEGAVWSDVLASLVERQYLCSISPSNGSFEDLSMHKKYSDLVVYDCLWNPDWTQELNDAFRKRIYVQKERIVLAEYNTSDNDVSTVLNKHIQLGTLWNDVKNKLEKEGFECSSIENGSAGL